MVLDFWIQNKHLVCSSCPKAGQSCSASVFGRLRGRGAPRGPSRDAGRPKGSAVLLRHTRASAAWNEQWSGVGRGARWRVGGPRGSRAVFSLWKQREKAAWLLPLFINAWLGHCGSSWCLERLQVLSKASVRLALEGKIILFYRLCLKSGGRCSSRGALCRDLWQINLQ